MHIDVLVPFFVVFRNEDLPLWLSIALIGIGFLFFLWYAFHVYTPVYKSLHSAVHALDAILGKQELYAKFDTIDDVFNRSLLKQNWDGFKETFIFPGKFDEEKVIRHTIRPSTYFNFENLSQQYNISFYQAFPNIVVGVGLLLTFCGLVSAIYLTGESISSVHADEFATHTGSLKNALDSLLRIAAFKFLTSIAGLITSIILSIEIRICNGRLRNEYSRLNAILERNLQYESQEHLILTQQTIALRQLDYLRKQSEQFQSFTTTFAHETAQKTALAINSVVKLHADKLYARIDPAIAFMGESIGKAADQAMTQLVRDFSAALRFEASNAMENLVQALLESQQALEAVSKNVKESGESLALMLAELGAFERQSREEIHQQAEASMGAMAEQVKTCVETLESRLEEAAEKLARSGDDVSATLVKSADCWTASSQNNAKAFEKTMTESLAPLQKTIENAQEHLQAFSGSLDQAGASFAAGVASACQDFSNAARSCTMQLMASQDGLVATSETLVRKRADIDEQIRKTMDKAMEQFAALSVQGEKQIADKTAFVEQSFASLGTTFAKGMEDSLTTMKGLQESLQSQLETTIKTFATSLTAIYADCAAKSQESADRLFAASSEIAGTIEESVQQSLAHMEHVDSLVRTNVENQQKQTQAQLQEIVAGIREGLRENLQLLQDEAALLTQQTVNARDTMAHVEEQLCQSIGFSCDAFKETAEQVITRAQEGASSVHASFIQSSESMQEKMLSSLSNTKTLFSHVEERLQELSQVCVRLAQSLESVNTLSEEAISKQQDRMDAAYSLVAEKVPSALFALTREYEALLKSTTDGLKGMPAGAKRWEGKKDKRHRTYERIVRRGKQRVSGSLLRK